MLASLAQKGRCSALVPNVVWECSDSSKACAGQLVLVGYSLCGLKLAVIHYRSTEQWLRDKSQFVLNHSEATVTTWTTDSYKHTTLLDRSRLYNSHYKLSLNTFSHPSAVMHSV